MEIGKARELYKQVTGKYPSKLMKLENIVAKLESIEVDASPEVVEYAKIITEDVKKENDLPAVKGMTTSANTVTKRFTNKTDTTVERMTTRRYNSLKAKGLI